MGHDPAFLFYPGDYLQDTQNLSEKSQVAYDRIMCKHMKNICISQQQLNFFTKRLSDEEKEEVLSVLTKIADGFQIEWVAESIIKRRDYSDSRRRNRAGNTEKNTVTYDLHMENENINESKNKDKIINNKNKKSSEIVFETIWNKYPSKDGKKEAERHFNASVLTLDDFSNIKKALANYINHLKNNSWKKPKNGSTWFNNWQDWTNWIEPVPETDELDDARKKLGLIKE